MEDDDYQRHLTRYEYSGPPGDPTRLLARIRRPRPTWPDGTPGPAAVDEFAEYDGRGRLRRHVDPAGVVTERQYFTSDDGRKEGHLRTTIADVGGLALATEREVDDLGRVVAVRSPRGAAAAPGELVSRVEYNPLDQVVRTIASAPFLHEVRRFYDKNGSLEREERDAFDEEGVPVAGGPQVRTLCHDAELHLTRETIGGADVKGHLVSKHRYDVAGRLAATFLPAGNVVRFAYDPRSLRTATTTAHGTADEATARTEYDGDGRVKETITPEGRATRLVRDPAGRVVAEEDAAGNVTRRSYDKAGHLLVERVFERREGGTFVLLARNEREYDELGRLVGTAHNRFEAPLPAADPDSDFLASPGPGEALLTRTFRDAKGRPLRVLDPLGRERRFEHDAVDRLLAETDPLGNHVDNRYDANGNLVRRDRRELVRDPDSGEVVGERVFAASWAYDQLDRPVQATDSLGNVTTFAYDSLGRQTQRIDPLGNVVRSVFDLFGRRVAHLAETTTSGLGGGSPLEPVVTRFEYDDNGNLRAVIDARDKRTRRSYDARDQLRTLTYPDDSQAAFTYDRDGQVIETRDPGGVVRRSTYDALGRLARVEVDRSEAEPREPGEETTFEAYRYDALGRRRHEENDFATIDTVVDSLGWPFEETVAQRVPGAPSPGPLTVRRSFSPSGALAELVYPGGRTLRHYRDGLDRLERIEQRVPGDAYPGRRDRPCGTSPASRTQAGHARAAGFPAGPASPTGTTAPAASSRSRTAAPPGRFSPSSGSATRPATCACGTTWPPPGPARPRPTTRCIASRASSRAPICPSLTPSPSARRRPCRPIPSPTGRPTSTPCGSRRRRRRARRPGSTTRPATASSRRRPATGRSRTRSTTSTSTARWPAWSTGTTPAATGSATGRAPTATTRRTG